MIVIKQKMIILRLYGMLYALDFWLKLISFPQKSIFFINNNFPGKYSKNANIMGLNEWKLYLYTVLKNISLRFWNT